MTTPPGAPDRPLTHDEIRAKVIDCAGERDGAAILAATWASTPSLVGRLIGDAIAASAP